MTFIAVLPLVFAFGITFWMLCVEPTLTRIAEKRIDRQADEFGKAVARHLARLLDERDQERAR
jgi:hypothetical protein